MKINFHNDNDLRIETTNVTTISHDKSDNIVKLMTKLVIIFVIVAGFTVFVVIMITLGIVYRTCNRPSRIHKQIPIAYLDSDQMMNHFEDTRILYRSEHSDIENSYIND